MSSRVRLVVKLPSGHVFTNMKAIHIMEAVYQERKSNLLLRQPIMFDKWPRWKRVVWIAKALKYAIHAFREPRRAKIQKSLYGAACQESGYGWGPLKRKNGYKISNKRIVINADINEIRAGRIIADRNGNIVPLEPRQYRAQIERRRPAEYDF
jgi:hypothetical protein